ncbi:hypothetical protein AJ78_08929 [Emergomyces pasteurianus Ep9510]|uniref:Uncharacterized protein n=1 Tax=Emergomyces pasteurianus Ep9510 TaxID=1447872 RepID=A0A1J9NYV3_9EURO|nr:hypothetical protein AJ78_08929 [Emergomyces pasteurianus Ep9510]
MSVLNTASMTSGTQSLKYYIFIHILIKIKIKISDCLKFS